MTVGLPHTPAPTHTLSPPPVAKTKKILQSVEEGLYRTHILDNHEMSGNSDARFESSTLELGSGL